MVVVGVGGSGEESGLQRSGMQWDEFGAELDVEGKARGGHEGNPWDSGV